MTWFGVTMTEGAKSQVGQKGVKRGQKGSKIKVCSIFINGVSFERYDLPDFEFFGFMFSISKVNWIIDLNWS